MIQGTGSFSSSMTSSMLGIMEQLYQPMYGGFLCEYFALNDPTAYVDCENTQEVASGTTLYSWMEEFKTIKTKAAAGTITVTDAFICFMGSDLFDAMLTGALPF